MKSEHAGFKVGDIVVHVMHPAVRSHYNLEELWGGKEVKLAKEDKPKKAKSTKKAKKKPAARRAAAPKKKPVRGKTAPRRRRK